MIGPLAPKLTLARAVGAISRRRGGGGTSAPGKALLTLAPDAIATLGERLARGSVVISATNGKTTTAAMAAAILSGDGTRLVHNRAGANMAGGIASTLLDAARPRGEIAGELGLFEVDELWLGRLVEQLRPRAIVLGNLFRDQLDRYGELDTIAERWAQTTSSGAGAAARLVLNADDPVLADIGRTRTRPSEPARTGIGAAGAADGRPAEPGDSRPAKPGHVGRDVIYFGVQDDSLALSGLAHAADAKHCRNCGAPYVFDAIYLGHLGRYHCAACGQARPEPSVSAREVRLEGVRAARFTLCTPQGEAEVRLALPGLYNVYNALAAAALACALEVPLARIVAGLQGTQAAFGRAETLTLEEPVRRELRILLVKNPAGANEVLRTLALEPGEHDVLGVLNDEIADGRDVSWIWDADFELLAGRVRRATCSGTRAAELAMRLKYAGVPSERIRVEPELASALDAAAADRVSSTVFAAPARAGAETSAPAATAASSRAPSPADAPPPLYALPTYTAMLALRDLLAARRGGAHRSALP
ncbi:MAG TPA: MurT ligase domain-containing protein [Solirubrobacteraceae bacterium]|nr:MurT ligase domain-containing protein [Solirubrobacteraceae bacterium]